MGKNKSKLILLFKTQFHVKSPVWQKDYAHNYSHFLIFNLTVQSTFLFRTVVHNAKNTGLEQWLKNKISDEGPSNTLSNKRPANVKKNKKFK